MIYKYLDKSPKFAKPFNGWVADTAVIIGDVTLGQNASVWFGAVIRGDNANISLGDNTNLQENCVIHTDEGIDVDIGNNVTIGHLAMLHGCTIGDNSLIGIGAVVLNNANIGKNCIIGAKALVTEGTQIPDNSLVVGAPAKVVKTLDKKHFDMLKRSAQIYVDKSKKFKEGLSVVEHPY